MGRDGIRAVVLDVDGVLVHPWRFRDLLVRDHGIHPETTRPFFEGPFLACLEGRADLREVLPPFLHAFGWPGSPERFIGTWLESENAPNGPLLDRVAELRAAGLRCCVASDQERLRAAYLTREMGFGARFDTLLFSCELGVRKSDPGFFSRAAERLGEAADALLFFDDRAAPVESARSAGWMAEIYRDLESFERDLARHLAGAGGLVETT